MELFEGDLPPRSGGQDDWCPFIKKILENELREDNEVISDSDK